MRIVMTLALLVTFASLARGQTYLLEGEISSGTTLFSIDEPTLGTGFNGFGFPEGGYPVEYRATFVVDTDTDIWAFAFTATDAAETVLHIVDGPSPLDTAVTNEVMSTPTQLSIEFHRFSHIGTTFNLSVDLVDMTGAWNWSEDCPVCDLIYTLPSAEATVASIQVVPEPRSFQLILSCLVALPLAQHLDERFGRTVR